ncbi:Benzoate membrane transport protein [compost metagenome]
MEETRLPAALTFITTASGITIIGVGAPFWGLVAGIGMMVLLRFGIRPEPETTGK